MSSPITPAPTASPAPAALTVAGRARAAGWRIRQAAAYVALLVWGVPLAAFIVVAVHADATPCAAVDGVPCDAQGVVVLTAVLVGILLIPLGLFALVLVAVLATALPPSTSPAALAVIASASVLAVAAALWGVVTLVAG